MIGTQDANAYELRRELDGWASRLDRLMRTPQGAWIAGTLGGRSIEDLDPAEIEVFCLMAHNQYRKVLTAHYEQELRRLRGLQGKGSGDTS